MRIRIREAFYDDPVTHHVRRDLVRLRIGQTVGEALAAMREQPPQGRIIYFYVIDSDGRLEGVVPTPRLLLSPLETPVADIMVRQVIALPVDATVLDACEFFILHRLLAFPVVDDQHRLVGVIDVDLYTEKLSRTGGRQGKELDVRPSDDLFHLIGVHLARARQTSPWPPSAAVFRGCYATWPAASWRHCSRGSSRPSCNGSWPSPCSSRSYSPWPRA